MRSCQPGDQRQTVALEPVRGQQDGKQLVYGKQAASGFSPDESNSELVMPAPSVLVTGASSGIGAATARLLLERGWRVFAAARRLEAMEPLAALGAEVLALDLIEERSRLEVAEQIAAKVGALDALVNNAGFGEVGPLETLPLDRARAIFEVNVFGLMGLTQQLLPAMRERGRGRIVNISSIAGRWVSPGSGWYGASKFALEALSDALRLELKAFGLSVVVVEPGLIATDFANVVGPSIERSLSCSTYSTMMRAVRKSWDSVYRGASPPLEVALTIERALIDTNPQARYLCGHQSASVIASRILPTRLWDTLVRLQMT
jgi:short-subunit dehydrogenase